MGWGSCCKGCVTFPNTTDRGPLFPTTLFYSIYEEKFTNMAIIITQGRSQLGRRRHTPIAQGKPTATGPIVTEFERWFLGVYEIPFQTVLDYVPCSHAIFMTEPPPPPPPWPTLKSSCDSFWIFNTWKVMKVYNNNYYQILLSIIYWQIIILIVIQLNFF